MVTRSTLGAATALLLLAAPLRTAATEGLPPLPAQLEGTPWPTAAWPEGAPGRGVDNDALAAAFVNSFADVGHSGTTDTRALLAVHRGRIVAERYAEGFGPDTRFHSWSMAKSVTQALVGLLVQRGELSLDEPAGVAAWSEPDDPRRTITLRNLLHMSAGLDNGDGHAASPAESYVADLLFGSHSRDVVARAIDAGVLHPPGRHWAYSTATSMILAHQVSETVGSGREDTLAFIRRALAAPLGITSLVPEFDAAGNFLGGGFVYATARDWARLGYLYLRDGVWDRRRLLPEGWVDFTRTPAPAINNGTHGAHFWLNGEPREGQFRPLPGGPPSAFQMSGNNGQVVVLVPTRDLLVVRLGEMQVKTWPQVNREMAAIVAAFPALGTEK